MKRSRRMPAETRVAGQLGNLYGLMAEFETPEDLLSAARIGARGGVIRKWTRIRRCRWKAWRRRSDSAKRWVQKIILAAGFLGACGGFTLCWWMTVVAYPHNVAGRPLNSWPAYVPITFESMVLVACVTALVSDARVERAAGAVSSGVQRAGIRARVARPVFFVHRVERPAFRSRGYVGILRRASADGGDGS